MLKWLCEVVYAFAMKKHLSTSFWRALSFVRCDHLIQQELDKLVGFEGPKKGDIYDRRSN